MDINTMYKKALHILDELELSMSDCSILPPRVESQANFDEEIMGLKNKGVSRDEKMYAKHAGALRRLFNVGIGGICYPTLSTLSYGDTDFTFDYHLVFSEASFVEKTSSIDGIVAEAKAVGLIAHELGHIWMSEKTAYGQVYKNLMSLMLYSDGVVTKLLDSLEKRDVIIAQATGLAAGFAPIAPIHNGIRTIDALDDFARYGSVLKRYEERTSSSEILQMIGQSEDEYRTALEEGISCVKHQKPLCDLADKTKKLNEGWCEYLNMIVMTKILSDQLSNLSGVDAKNVRQTIASWSEGIKKSHTGATESNVFLTPYVDGLAMFAYFPDFQTARNVASTSVTDLELEKNVEYYIPKPGTSIRDRLMKSVNGLLGKINHTF